VNGSVGRDLFCWGGPRPFGRSVLYLGLVLLAAFALNRQALAVDGPAFNDGHALASLELAIVRADCGQPSSFSNSFRIPYDIRDHVELRFVPLRTLIVRKAGSIEAFCRSVDQRFVNNENSLMLLESVILRLSPQISLVEMGRVLQVVRIAAVAGFVLLLLQFGASLALGLAIMMCSLMLMDRMVADVYSAYPFLFVLLLVLTAFYGFALQFRWTRRIGGLVLTACLAGLLSAFIANMRTSYFPIVLLSLACFAAGEFNGVQPFTNRRSQFVRVMALLAAFVTGYAVLQYGLILRGIPAEARHGASHSIGHPLVLAISVPENEFSRRMGITWLDEVGRQKALGVDPDAVYLGPRYDKALLTYYRALWRQYPLEMLGVYRLKFSTAGTHMLAVLRGAPGPLRMLLAPLSLAPSGIWLLGFYALIATGSLWLFVRDGATPMFVMVLLSGMACLAQIESGLIYSLFYYQYHNYLAFFAIFISLLGAQALVNAVALVVRRGAGSWQAKRQFSWLIQETASFKSRSLPSAAIRAACALCVTWMVAPQWFSIERTVTTDRQAFDVMDAAIAKSACGRQSAGSPSIKVAEQAATSGDFQVVPIRSVVLAKAGTLEAYCRSGAMDVLRPRSPLLMLETSILRLRPNISAAGLAKALHYVRLAGVLGFVLLLMNAGYGAAFGCAMTFSGLWLLVTMKEQLYSVSPFNFVLVLLSAVLYGCAIQWRWLSTPWGYVAAGATAGAWSALVVGMDPRYLVMQAGLLAVFILADRVVNHGAEAWRTTWRPALLIAGAVAAYVVFQRGLWRADAVDVQSPAANQLSSVSALLGSAWMLGFSLLVVAAALVWLVRSRSMAASVPAFLGTAACLLPGRIGTGAIRGSGEESYLVFFAIFVMLLCCQGVAALYWGAVVAPAESRPA
jgi:hypothetical protein